MVFTINTTAHSAIRSQDLAQCSQACCRQMGPVLYYIILYMFICSISVTVVLWCQAFLTDEFTATHPEYQNNIVELKSLIRQQVCTIVDVSSHFVAACFCCWLASVKNASCQSVLEDHLKGSVKEPNISIYFFFPPITQWCTISSVVYWWKGSVRF